MGYQHYPHRLDVALPLDPLAATARLAGSPIFGSHVGYERDGVFSFAGDAAAEVVLTRHEFQIRLPDREYRLPVTDPVRDLAGVLAGLPGADWQLYGWVGFEFGCLCAGLTELLPDGPLLHLIVPAVEVRLTAEGATFRGRDRAALRVLAELVADAGAAPVLETVPVPVSDTGEQDYRAKVAAIVDEVRAGRLSKAILSRIVPIDFEVDFVGTYLNGRRHNDPARSFLLRLGDLTAAGFSPETVVEVAETGRVTSQPLAGTRARFADDPARNRLLRDELLNSPKEIFEHAISVQLALAELDRICLPGSTGVETFMRVAERGTVQHLASAVVGQLAPGRTALDAFGTLFPAVTASGIPKAAAYAAISRHEQRPRGLYGGAVLRANARGELDAALALRTVFRRSGRTWLQAGAGIVADSEPAREFEETCEKLRCVAAHVVPARPNREETDAARMHAVADGGRGAIPAGGVLGRDTAGRTAA